MERYSIYFIFFQAFFSFSLMLFGVDFRDADIAGLRLIIPGIEKFASYSKASNEVGLVFLIGWYLVFIYAPIVISKSKTINLESEYRCPIISILFWLIMLIAASCILYYGVDDNDAGLRISIFKKSKFGGVVAAFVVFYAFYALLGFVVSGVKSLITGYLCRA